MATIVDNHGNVVSRTKNLGGVAGYARKIRVIYRAPVAALRAWPVKATGGGVLVTTFANGATALNEFASWQILQTWAATKAKCSGWPALDTLEHVPGYSVQGDRARVAYIPLTYPNATEPAGRMMQGGHWLCFRDHGDGGGMTAGARHATLAEAIAYLEKLGHAFPPETKTAP